MGQASRVNWFTCSLACNKFSCEGSFLFGNDFFFFGDQNYTQNQCMNMNIFYIANYSIDFAIKPLKFNTIPVWFQTEIENRIFISVWMAYFLDFFIWSCELGFQKMYQNSFKEAYTFESWEVRRCVNSI